MLEETKIGNNTIGRRYIIINEKTNTKKEDNRKWNQKLRITDGVFTLRLPTHNSLSGSPLTP